MTDPAGWPLSGEFVVQVPDPADPGVPLLAHVRVALEHDRPVSIDLPGRLREAIAACLPVPPFTMTDEQAAEFREQFEAAMRDPGRQQMRVLPQPPPLTPDETRALLRECVLAVAPGEILVIRFSPGSITPSQMREFQEYVDFWLERNAPGIRALAIIGDAAQAVRKEPGGIVHACPPHGDLGAACCGISPLDVPDGDRMSMYEDEVTCGKDAP